LTLRSKPERNGDESAPAHVSRFVHPNMLCHEQVFHLLSTGGEQGFAQAARLPLTFACRIGTNRRHDHWSAQSLTRLPAMQNGLVQASPTA
ncbi:hypothetical protein, partial [Mesorhizobium sp.]|uniref:hypothetical protein n=1 Tax=Mesorhizobium sp. TaxID=1871066 RepID=UPI0025F925BF